MDVELVPDNVKKRSFVLKGKVLVNKQEFKHGRRFKDNIHILFYTGNS
jgi:hypothetical protein